ncbi:MAG: hypothetical protein AB7Q42_13840 [Acidimicrobiia bacterium]
MTERGLVTKEPCDSHRRGPFVVVTRRGRTEIRNVAPGHVASVRRLFLERLTPAQLDAVGAAAETVLAALDERASTIRATSDAEPKGHRRDRPLTRR